MNTMTSIVFLCYNPLLFSYYWYGRWKKRVIFLYTNTIIYSFSGPIRPQKIKQWLYTRLNRPLLVSILSEIKYLGKITLIIIFPIILAEINFSRWILIFEEKVLFLFYYCLYYKVLSNSQTRNKKILNQYNR